MILVDDGDEVVGFGGTFVFIFVWIFVDDVQVSIENVQIFLRVEVAVLHRLLHGQRCYRLTLHRVSFDVQFICLRIKLCNIARVHLSFRYLRVVSLVKPYDGLSF